MSSIKGKRQGHSHNNTLARAKELDANPENFDSTLESSLNRVNNKANMQEFRAAEFREEQRQIAEAKLREPKVLMRDGKWLVPPEERPVGWERLRLAEPS